MLPSWLEWTRVTRWWNAEHVPDLTRWSRNGNERYEESHYTFKVVSNLRAWRYSSTTGREVLEPKVTLYFPGAYLRGMSEAKCTTYILVYLFRYCAFSMILPKRCHRLLAARFLLCTTFVHLIVAGLLVAVHAIFLCDPEATLFPLSCKSSHARYRYLVSRAFLT